MPEQGGSNSWSKEIISRLPLPKQTRAQTANHIFDVLATVGLCAFIARYDEALLSFILFLVVIAGAFSCVIVTMPKR